MSVKGKLPDLRAPLIAWRPLFSFLRLQDVFILVPAVIFTILSAFIQPVNSILLGYYAKTFTAFAAGKVSADEMKAQLTDIVIGLVVLGFLSWLLNGVFFCAWVSYGESQARSARELLFNTLLRREYEWFEMQETNVKVLLTKSHNQINDFRIGSSQEFGNALLSVVQSIASIAVAFHASWHLTLVMFALFPTISAILAVLARGIRPAINRQKDCLTRASKWAQFTFDNIDTVKCHGTQQQESRRYNHAIFEADKPLFRQAHIVSLQLGFMRFASMLAIVVILFLGSVLVHKFDANVGSTMTALFSCTTALTGVSEILSSYLVLEKGRTAAAALHNLIAEAQSSRQVKRQTKSVVPQRLQGDIELLHVSFTYPSRPDHKVLRTSSFCFPAHETTFVVGQSGCGKSTLNNLLLKFYEPSSGSILLDGTDIRQIDTQWLRNNITLVQQHSTCFNETVQDNIALGCYGAEAVDPSRIDACIDFASLRGMIAALPEGADTKLDNGGQGLSGGQKQRLALARARLRDSPIVILDESTSAMDHSTAATVMRNIRSWRKDKSTIIITHNLSQIHEDDFVYVLNNGEIIAEGFRSDISSYFESRTSMKFLHERFNINPVEKAQEATAANKATKFEKRKRMTMARSLYLQPNVSSQSAVSDTSTADSQDHLLQRSSDLDNVSELLNTRPKPKTAMRLEHSEYNHKSFRPLPVKYTSVVQATAAETLHKCLTLFADTRAFSVHGALSKQHNPAEVQVPYLSDRSTVVSVKHDEIELLAQEQYPRKVDKQEPLSKYPSFTTILGTVWPVFSSKQRLMLVVAAIGLGSHILASILVSWLTVKLLGTAYLPGDWVTPARKWSLIMSSVAASDGIATYAYHHIMTVLGQHWINALRQQAFDTVVAQPRAWFDCAENQTVRICAALYDDAELLRELLADHLPFVLSVSLMVIGSFIWSFTICWQLALLGLSAMPLSFGVSSIYNAVSRKWEQRSHLASIAILAAFSDSFADIRTVRALTLEEYFHRKYLDITTKAFRTGLARAAFAGTCYGATGSVVHLIAAAAFRLGIHLAGTADCSSASILTILSMLIFISIGATDVFKVLPEAHISLNAAGRLLELGALGAGSDSVHNEVHPLSNAFHLPIELQRINFSYPNRPHAQILKDVNVIIKPRCFTTIVGRSGSGKSTVLALLLRFYRLDRGTNSGSISIAGRNLNDIDNKALCEHIAFVPQNTAMFPLTVRENILYGLADGLLVTEENLNSAAKAANILDVIASLPQGFDTMLGDGGLGLSGGQAQRIAIARAIARQPKILILDEPTSALDPENARAVRETIESLVKGMSGSSVSSMTVIMITHSRDMMRFADDIIVLEDGRFVEQGTYVELDRKHTAFWRLLNSGDTAESNA